MKKITVREIPDDVHAKLLAIKADRTSVNFRRSVNYLIVEAIEQYVARQPARLNMTPTKFPDPPLYWNESTAQWQETPVKPQPKRARQSAPNRGTAPIPCPKCGTELLPSGRCMICPKSAPKKRSGR